MVRNYLKPIIIITVAEDTGFLQLSSAIEVLSHRMNITDDMIAGYDERVQGFSNRILTFSEKTNSLQSKKCFIIATR